MAAGSFDMVVIGAGPAGAFAALRAASLGARTALVTNGALGGMAANDGPIPVRTLAHAARLVRDARGLGRYGIAGCDPVLDYPRLLQRVAEVVEETGRHSTLRPQLDAAGVTILENVGPARFKSEHVIAMADGRRLQCGQAIVCTGGVHRSLPIPGFDLTATHSDAWGLQSVPESMLIVGGGATGLQVASVFNAFGTRIDLFEAHDRILRTEDEDVAVAVEQGFRARGITIHSGFGVIDCFEKVADGVAMHFSRDGQAFVAQAALIVTALGWVAQTEALDLAAAGVAINARGFIQVDGQLRTTAPGIYAAGDVTGRLMLAPQAIQDGIRAATNALSSTPSPQPAAVNPMGSFTDPEYAQVGLTEAQARDGHEVEVALVRFDETTRPIIDGRTEGFCKLIADPATGRMLGCHIVGERAVDTVQIAAVAMAASMTVSDFARIPLAFPTYAGALARAATTLDTRMQVTAAQTRA
ncbi:mercury(II) reductase [Sphingomonas sp. DBB INV C78]|uniref:dihydrolipoyl dehydrogenase family protein n=1 Tax=Sphingomonas sp. DBB INV C78 TaxID=3349434 RepID=UPI0036D2798D